MQEYQNNLKKELETVVARLAEDLASLHSSRATPALVENIKVSAYGSIMPIKELASLSAPDARTIVVQPWDAGILPEIQNALSSTHLGLGIAVDEKFIRLTLPQLSDERRRDVLKALGKRVEEARIAIRHARDRFMKSIDDAERRKEMSEDDKFRLKQSLQKTVDESNKKIQDLESKKESEIRKV